MSRRLEDFITINNISDLAFRQDLLTIAENEPTKKHSYSNNLTNKITSYADDFEIAYPQNINIKKLDEIIRECINEYATSCNAMPFNIKEMSPIRFNKYKVGTNMKPHCDHIHTLFDGERKGIPILTVLGLLNDDFEGGDFLMFDGKKLNLSAGDIVIFPSNFMYPHSVTTVTKGTRYSFVCWAW
jgi:predicted 2-oxoglutarate/Fe(II)-dependent dioxygenase YbiX